MTASAGSGMSGGRTGWSAGNVPGFFFGLLLFAFHAVALRAFFADIFFALDDGLGAFFIGQF